MDMVSMIASISTEMAAAQTQSAVSTAVFKKVLEQQGAAVLPLIAAATGVNPAATASVNSPAHLGQSVDVFV